MAVSTGASGGGGAEEVEKHILRKYEICQKLGKGVRERDRRRFTPFFCCVR